MNNKSKTKTKGSILIGERLVITTKEARKLLGKDFNQFSDDQIDDIITKLDLLAQGFINSKVSI